MPLVDVRTLSSPPVIGRYYKVPCLQKDGRWWPVTGEKHEDLDYIGFEPAHFHLDVRFIPPQLIRGYSTRYGPYGHFFASVMHDGKTEGGWIDCGKPALRARLCYRDWPRYPAVFRKLHEAYKSAKLAACRVCPHRGYPLNQVTPRDGKLICPLHGLVWDAKSGANVQVQPCKTPDNANLSAPFDRICAEAKSIEKAANKIHAQRVIRKSEARA
ncbi:MAG: Rieske 2Fe-2S domain-containing protein [Planctomycetota bacterium]|nr:Rieske 2Fe-2S domain-containing protein [Planctomycetota bacterium]